MKLTVKSIVIAGFGFLGWVVVYVFQHQLFYDPFKYLPIPVDATGSVYLPEFDHTKFVFSKLFRYFLNDIFGILIIHGLFHNRSYNAFAFLLMLFGLILILPVYFYLLFNHIESIYAYLNHIHRVILNPVLMIILIVSLFYQHLQKN